MAQSYLAGDRFGTFDRAFGQGVQLGTQIVRERQERQQKLEDQVAQQKAERDAEDHRAELSKRTYAANLAEELKQKAQQLKDNVNDPVLNRQTIIQDNIAAQLKNLDAQDANNRLALAAGDKDYTNEAKTFAQQALQKNLTKRQALTAYATQKIDPSQPLAPISPDAQFDATNDVSSLAPEARFQSEYLSKGNKGDLTSYQQWQIERYNREHPPLPGGVTQKNVDGAHRSIASTFGAASAFHSYPEPEMGQSEDPAVAHARASSLTTFDKYSQGATAALIDPNSIEAIAHVSHDDAQKSADYAKTLLSRYGTLTTKKAMAFKGALLEQANNPYAKILLKTIGSPYSEPAPEADAGASPDDTSNAGGQQ